MVVGTVAASRPNSARTVETGRVAGTQPRVQPCHLTLLFVESQVAPSLVSPLKIGEVARRSGLTVKTIRFSCDEGLIQPISRSAGGYRLFGEEVFAELALIRTLKAMEIPLQDVTRILESRRSGVCTCASLKATIRSKAGDIAQKIAALGDLHRELEGLLNSWEDCGGRKS
jgi:DNA-binding transcriptional MerR regulator